MYRVVLALLVVVQLANSTAAILYDTVVMVPDGADYFDWSAQISRALRRGEVREAARLLWGNPQRPPLCIVPAVLTQTVFGVSPWWARISTLFWMGLLIWLTYRLTRELHSPEAGLAAAAVVAAMPAVMGFSRLTWLDVALAAATAAAMYGLHRSRRFTHRAGSLTFGFVVGLGLLVKQALPVFLLVPTAVQFLRGVRQREGRGRVVANALLAGFVATGLFATWAVCHLWAQTRAFEMAETVVRPGAPTVALSWGDRLATLAAYVGDLPTNLAGPVVTLMFLAAIAVLVLHRRGEALVLTGTWLGSAPVLLTLFVHWDRYMIPALPAMAVVVGVATGVCVSRGLSWRRWLAPAVVLGSTTLTLVQTWIGPLAQECPIAAPSWRAHCSGMVKPVHRPFRRPPMKLDVDGPALEVVVSPGFVLPDPAPPPMDRIPERIRQWLITDNVQHAEAIGVTRAGQLTEQQFMSFTHAIIVAPGPGRVIPGEVRGIHEQVLRWISDESRWRLVKQASLDTGATLRVYRNNARRLNTTPAYW